jgi:predicted kinase
MTIMRGLPGSGKSFLAKKIAGENNASIYSADDWFVRNGRYVFKKDQLGIAHARCQQHVRISCQQGVNVVVDNTNTSWNEISVYVDIAKEFGYNIQIAVPDWTPHLFIDGKWNVHFLSGRNTHGVPDSVLDIMAANYDYDVDSKIANEIGVK